MMKRPYVILDRDGTINAERNYLSDPDQLELLPNAAAGLRKMTELGLGLVVVTNQSAIGRGYFDHQKLTAIHNRLEELLSQEGVKLDGVFYCPHHPDDDCDCRKPRTGLVKQAAAQLGFDPAFAFCIGDKRCDIELGRAVGAQTLLVRTGYGAKEETQRDIDPDFTVDDLAQAAEMIEQQLLGPEAVSFAPPTELDWAQERMTQHLEAAAAVMLKVRQECDRDILLAAGLIADTFRNKNKVLICGNGGSAADSQHMAAEFVSRLTKDFVRPALPAVALTTDSSFLTAFANDCGYDGVFERQVSGLGKKGDLLLGISTSGSSRNVVLAFETARSLGMRTIALCGDGGSLAKMADVAICVPSAFTQVIQEAHVAVEHILCDLTERMVFGNEPKDSKVPAAAELGGQP